MSNSVLAVDVPKDLNESFLEAVKKRDSGDIFASIALLEQLIASQPQYKRAELELAVAYYRATLYTEAKQYAESVLADPETPASVKETIEIFLDQVASEQEAADENRHHFNGSIKFGGGRDSNVNASPASDLISINGIEYSLSHDSVAQEDHYGLVNLLVGHSYSIPGTVGLGSRPVQREWATSLNLYRKAFSDLGDYNLDVATLSTGMNYLSSTDWRASIAARIDHVSLGGQQLGLFKGLNGSYSKVDGVNEYSFTASLTDQAFEDAANAGREGVNYNAAATVFHQFDSTVTGKAGVQVALNDAKVDNKQYIAKSLNAGLYYTANSSVLLYGELNYKLSDYDGVEPVYARSRDDREFISLLGVTYSISEGPIADWKVNAHISGTNNTSNISIYDYSKTDIAIDLSKRF